MPWQAGIVVRVTPSYTGPTCWDDEYAGGFDIKPQRADYHDQDLANAITQTLNIAGQNAMIAPLQMGGFKVTGMAPGTAQTDGATVSQIQAAGTVLDTTQRWDAVTSKWVENLSVKATSTGIVTATAFVGGLSGNAATATTALQLNSIPANQYPTMSPVNSKFAIVSALPGSPDVNTIYFVTA